MTIFLASEIARIYQQNSEYEMALKFYERISITYRKEKWYTLLADILKRIKDCAFNIKNYKLFLSATLELINTRYSDLNNQTIERFGNF
jgi:hypothetical protein